MPTTAAPVRRPGTTPAGRVVTPPGRGTGHLVPAAASPLSPRWLHGPVSPALVVAVFPDAAYVLRGDEVLPVLASAALALPGGLRVAGRDELRALGLRVGEDVLVGAGRLHVGDAGLVVRRTWRPRAVPSAPLPTALRERARRALDGVRDDDLPSEVVGVTPTLVDEASVQVHRLVGLGPGLTPAGDDALCGLLLGLRATGRERERARLERDLIPLLGRTTALSATLLRQAAAGYAVPPAVELLHAWHHPAPDPPGLDRLVDAVAAVGHTSGRALLVGLAAALAPRHTHPRERETP